LVIIGDSQLIMKALILRSRIKNAKFHHILEKIQLLLGKLRFYKLYHVLRNLNVLADAEANKCALFNIETLHLNETMSKMDLP